MKDKDNPTCEGSGQTTGNPREPSREADIDWYDVRGFNPHRERLPATTWEDHLSPAETWAISAAMASAARPSPENADPSGVLDPSRGARVAARRQALTAGSSLANLYARQTLDDRRMRAAIEFREKFRISTGGIAAADWMREKVDGGRRFIGPDGGLVSALDAERQCRAWLRDSGMGLAAAEVVLRVAGHDEALTTVAMDFEDTPKTIARAKETGEPSRYAQDHVRRLLREGLRALADHLYGRERRNDRMMAGALRDWLTLDLAR